MFLLYINYFYIKYKFKILPYLKNPSLKGNLKFLPYTIYAKFKENMITNKPFYVT